ncbi:MAG: glutathione S-transferase family protein [Polyangiaceae bacterium]
MMKLHGFPMSPNARRAQITLEEVGAPYEYVTVDLMQGAQRSEGYLGLNPNARIPTLVDGDLVVWESHAICQYLAAKYPDKHLDAENPVERAQISQWLFINAAHFGPSAAGIFANTIRLPEDQRIPRIVENGRAEVTKVLGIMDRTLAKAEHLAAGRFTLVEISFAPSLAFLPMLGFDLSKYPNVGAWFERLRARPSVKKVLEG